VYEKGEKQEIVCTNGNQIPVSKVAYDMAGRVIAETNALNVVMSYAYAFDGSGQSVKTKGS